MIFKFNILSKFFFASLLFLSNSLYAVELVLPSVITFYLNDENHIINPTMEFGVINERIILPGHGPTCYVRGYTTGSGKVKISDDISLHLTAKDWRDASSLRYVPNDTFPYSGDELGLKAAEGLGFNVQATLIIDTSKEYEAGQWSIGAVRTDVTLSGESHYFPTYNSCWDGEDDQGYAGTYSEPLSISGGSVIELKYK